jgi:predicted PurR-regulated permease PerM
MLALDHRAARSTWTVLIIGALLVALYQLRQTLLVVVFAVMLAYLLSPAVILVNRLSRKRASHTLSLAVVYLAMLAVGVAILSWIGTRAAEEAATLASALPRYLRNPPPMPQLALPEWMLPYQEQAVQLVRQKLEEDAGQMVPMLAAAGKGLLAAVGNVVYVILVPILSFFLLNDAQKIRDGLVSQFRTPARRRLMEQIADGMHRTMAQFVKGMVLLGFATFLCYSSALWLLGVKYSLLLSVLAGAVEFIPVAGPLTAAIAIVVTSAVTGSGNLAGVVVFLIAYRLFLDYVLSPWIMGGGLELSPLEVILGVIAGEKLGGIPGMVLAIPVLASLRVVYKAYRSEQSAE